MLAGLVAWLLSSMVGVTRLLRPSPAKIFWTAFIGLFFDYYDLYLFVYLEKVLAVDFALSQPQSHWLQFTGLAGVGAGALGFGYLADRFGRGRMLLAVFAVYAAGVAGLSLAWNYESLLGFRLLASLSLGAEWGISHTYLTERVGREQRYRFAALLQFSILGGLLAAMASRFALPVIGWRWLFAASIAPVAVLALVRWRGLTEEQGAGSGERELGTPSLTSALPAENLPPLTIDVRLGAALRANFRPFLLCFGLASLTIASGTMNVFFAKDLPQSPVYTVFFWGNVAPGMLLGAWVVRRWGLDWALRLYAGGLVALSLGAWLSAAVPHATGSGRAALAFALVLPLLNGIPFGLMGAWFNEVFGSFRTMLSGAAYNLGRILAGFVPVLITGLGLHENGRYFLVSALLGAGVWGLAVAIHRGGLARPR